MPLFVSEWIHKYKESFIQPENLQQIVDSFMKEYDKQKEEVRPLLTVFIITSSYSVYP